MIVLEIAMPQTDSPLCNIMAFRLWAFISSGHGQWINVSRAHKQLGINDFDVTLSTLSLSMGNLGGLSTETYAKPFPIRRLS